MNFIQQVLSFFIIKYAQWILVYLCIAMMNVNYFILETKSIQVQIFNIKTQSPYFWIFISLFTLDKLIRIFILCIVVAPQKGHKLVLVLSILLQFEEAFGYYENNGKKEDEYDDLDISINTSFAYESQNINLFMIPTIIFVLVWTIITQNELAFLLALPAFLYLFFIISFFFGKNNCQTDLNFTQMVPEFLMHIAYLGLIFICSQIDYFIMAFLILNITLCIFMGYRHNRSFHAYLYTQNQQRIFLQIQNVFFVFFQSGIDLRYQSSKDVKKCIKLNTNRNFNWLTISKLLQFSCYLTFLFLWKFEVLKSNNNNVKFYFIIIILSLSSISLAINIVSIIIYMIIPLIYGQQYIEIENNSELVKYNNLNREKKLYLNQVQYVCIYINPQTYMSNINLIHEFDYCLLFNFGSHSFTINQVGSRNLVNDYSNNISIKFNRFVNLPKLEQALYKDYINPLISSIEFQTKIELNDILRLIRLLNKFNCFAVVKSIEINPSLLSYQQQFQLKTVSIINHIHTFQNTIFYELTLNPREVLFDLFE